MPKRQHICMLAAENAAIPGAKVGGIGDVLRHLPPALADLNTKLSVVIPAYGLFHRTDDAKLVGELTVPFMGAVVDVDVFERTVDSNTNVRTYVLHAELFSACGEGSVYCNDPDHEPFATDASKFALFSVAALRLIETGLLGGVDVIHLHDWHAAFAVVLLKYAPEFQGLSNIITVYSIHNLAMQGVRPFSGHTSSLQSWYPSLKFEKRSLVDPRWEDCINPTAAAIRLCDKIHTVSPSYAREIQVPNDTDRGFHGGEGLESDLQDAARTSRLHGITNGCQYDDTISEKMDWLTLIKRINERIHEWLEDSVGSRDVDSLACERTLAWCENADPAHVLTSIGRLTDQKMALMLHQLDGGNSTLERALDIIGERSVFILLASGNKALEEACYRIASERQNFIFLNRFDAELAEWLYAHGDLFLMPSSFEPCGISQMMAMRYGQPCLAHSVGGLRDTITDNIDGYLFSGVSKDSQSEHLLKRLADVITQRIDTPDAYTLVSEAARAKRFSWKATSRVYIERLYS